MGSIVYIGYNIVVSLGVPGNAGNTELTRAQWYTMSPGNIGISWVIGVSCDTRFSWECMVFQGEYGAS